MGHTRGCTHSASGLQGQQKRVRKLQSIRFADKKLGALTQCSTSMAHVKDRLQEQTERRTLWDIAESLQQGGNRRSLAISQVSYSNPDKTG
jgi:hypothetical protein